MSLPDDPVRATRREPPLIVDMDGTLIDTDSLYEGVMQLWKIEPRLPLLIPLWLLRGKAALKREIANRVTLDAAFLPYNQRLLSQLRQRKGTCALVLCSAADHRFAGAVAAHIGLFDEVVATRGDVNLTSGAKARALVERYGAGGFDYAGNDVADLRVFADARHAHLVNPTFALRRRVSQVTNRAAMHDVPARAMWSRLREYLRALRPHQWVKNVLVYVPLLATTSLEHLDKFVPATLAAVCLCLVSSSGYLMNDLIDLGADRRHPRKRLRPIAAGTVPLQHAMAMIPLLLITAFAIASRISLLFSGVLLLHLVCASLYTFWLKRVPLLDTLVLAGLYTLRIFAGAAAIMVVPSVWLISFSMFFFLSLALAKRHSELVELQGTDNDGAIPGREYQTEDLGTLISQGSASGYSAVLVLALYIDSTQVRQQYRHPEIIWLICPLVLYWINKLWLNSARRQINDDPVIWAFKNRVSRGIAFLSVVLLLLARWLP
ncbi:MAG: UbiA family prenyltransferase [Gemmatimonadota bacterium]|nr:UbiA family prenyltransferase [Gemmatimonadota bacterium]